ncbi:MAG: amino acid ABC transporter permease [Dermatophilaceae bacterium]
MQVRPCPGSRADSPDEGADLVVVPTRHWGRLPLALGVLFLVGTVVHALATSPNVDWSVVRENLAADTIVRGVGVTAILTVASMGLGIVVGVVAALMRGSSNPVLVSVALGFIWVFRGTPVLVQLIFWFNLGLLFPTVGIGLPGVGELWVAETNAVITGFTAALLGLGLNEGAYMAEIIRAGLLSVDVGQSEASLALGMTRSQTLRSVVMPQALRVIVPPTGNEVVTMLKTTALVSVISGSDLLTSAQSIYSRNFAVIELLIVASVWYLALTSVLSAAQWAVERRLGRHGGGRVRALGGQGRRA